MGLLRELLGYIAQTRFKDVLPGLVVAAVAILLVYAVVRHERGKATKVTRDWAAVRNWLVESVRFFRQVGFFEQYAGLSDEETADRIEAACRQSGREPFDRSDPMADMDLVSLDTARVWWHDLKMGVGELHDVYVSVLGEWATISRGAFLPYAITETWECNAVGDTAIRIEFMLNGKGQWVQPKGGTGKWVDIGILEDINQLIKDTGYRYFQVGYSGFLVVVTNDEKHLLAKERGWCLGRPGSVDLSSRYVEADEHDDADEEENEEAGTPTLASWAGGLAFAVIGGVATSPYFGLVWAFAFAGICLLAAAAMLQARGNMGCNGFLLSIFLGVVFGVGYRRFQVGLLFFVSTAAALAIAARVYDWGVQWERRRSKSRVKGA